MYAQKAIVHNAPTLHTVRNVHNAQCAYRFKVQSCDCINFVRAIELVAKLEALAKKYETTFAEVEEEIAETEKSLSAMIDDLEGGEFDMLGLGELKKLLGGVQND